MGRAGRHAADCIRIDGLVARRRTVTAADLAPLRRVALERDFACEEGWTAPRVRWRGVRLADVLAAAGPLAAARYVRVCAGRYAAPLPLAAARHALLCDEVNGRPLGRTNGGPWRLVWPGRACFTSVKHVDRLHLAAEPGPNDAERIATERLSAPRRGGRPAGSLRSLARSSR